MGITPTFTCSKSRAFSAFFADAADSCCSWTSKVLVNRMCSSATDETSGISGVCRKKKTIDWQFSLGKWWDEKHWETMGWNGIFSNKAMMEWDIRKPASAWWARSLSSSSFSHPTHEHAMLMCRNSESGTFLMDFLWTTARSRTSWHPKWLRFQLFQLQQLPMRAQPDKIPDCIAKKLWWVCQEMVDLPQLYPV